MSIKAMNWVWNLDNTIVSSVYKVTLLALADHCDDSGVCYPSIKRLTEKTGLSRTTIKSHIKKLQISGVLTVLPVYEDNGSRGTNLYKLLIDGVGQNLTPVGQQTDHKPNNSNNIIIDNIIDNLSTINNDSIGIKNIFDIGYLQKTWLMELDDKELELAAEVSESMLNQISYDAKKQRYYRFNKNGNKTFYKNIWSVFRSWLKSAKDYESKLKTLGLKRVHDETGKRQRIIKGISDFSSEQDYLPNQN